MSNKSKLFSSFTAGIRIIFIITGLGFVAAWLVLGNLGCIRDILLNGVQIKFDPDKVVLIPDTTLTVNAKVDWTESKDLLADWSISKQSNSAFSSVSIKPATGYFPKITLKTADAADIYRSNGIWTNTKSISGPVVSAKFIDPLSVTLLGEEVKVTRKRYLPVTSISPKLSVTIPALQPIVSSDGYVRSLVLGSKAEVINAPASWKYAFEFSILVRAHRLYYFGIGSSGITAGAKNTFLSNKDIPVNVSADGKSAKFKFPTLKLSNNDTLFSKHTIMGHYIVEVSVRATVIGGEADLMLRQQATNTAFVNQNLR